jgi:hypothetical protein
MEIDQMKKVLFGPDGYQNGIPYNFYFPGLIDTALMDILT